jgi:hypothetical protein
MSAKLKTISFALVVLSFAVCSFVIVAVAGIWNTPFSTTDSAGRAIGFNDRLSPEHYGIMFSNFRIQTLFDSDYFYSWLLLAMHGRGAWLIVRQGDWSPRRIRRFFALQGLLFPLGWIGFLVLPSTIRSIFHGTLDREGIIDVPFIAITAAPIWIATAMTIVFLLRGASTRFATSIQREPFVA